MRMLAVLLLVVLAGCADGRLKYSQEELQNLARVHLHAVEQTRQELLLALVERARLEYEESQATHGPEPTYDILVMSGGGQYGAFGAGFLKGWGEVPEPSMRRPRFDYVTGVSTGSLIAPFAFLGDDAEYERVDRLYQEVDDTFAVLRGLLFFLPWRDSFYDNSKLNQYIASNIDEELVGRIAESARRHRILLVATTNLDLGVMRVWHLSAEAARAKPEAAAQRLRDILRASCAIPAVFAPVQLDGCLHVDGGTTGQLFLGADPTILADMIERLHLAEPEIPMPKVRIWVLVNGKLSIPADTTGSGWVSVAQRSLATLLQASTLSTLRRLEALTLIMNGKCHNRFEVRFVAVPDDVEEPKAGVLFDKEFMRRLSARGQSMGCDPSSWISEVPIPEWSVGSPREQ